MLVYLNQQVSVFNPLTAMGAYMRPAKAIDVDYGRKCAPGEGFGCYYGLMCMFGNYLYHICRTLAETTYLVA